MSTILITGASSGLGAEMARQFAALGHDLALCARRTDRLETLKAEIAAAHPDVRVAVKALDVNDHDAVFRVFEEFRDEFGGLDRVIVNAGLGKGQPLGTGRFDANRETAETNFIGALAQTEAAAQIFRAQNAGHLVMVSSFSALRGMPKNITTYAATKAARRPPRRGLPRRRARHADQGDRALPGLHRLRDVRHVGEHAADGLDREGRARDGRGHREGEGVGPGPGRGRGLRSASCSSTSRSGCCAG